MTKLERNRKWRLENPEKNRVSQRAYRLKNPAKVKEQKRKWRLANPLMVSEQAHRARLKNYDKYLLAERRWSAANRDKMKAADDRYRKANPERYKMLGRQWRSARRARLRLATIGDLTDIQKIYERCAELREWFSVVVDHIIPLAKGGTHEATNLQIIYDFENRTKNARLDYKPRVVFV